MEVSGSPLPDSINPNNFPAKLWRLVNNPANKAICWDRLGQVVMIDQHLFEQQILSPRSTTKDNADAFKTSNFSSFVRQLNLYGFRKVDQVIKDTGDSAVYHLFSNLNFKRDHPELVACLRRLTVDNKAKMQAGLNVRSRPPSRHQQDGGGNDGRRNVKSESPSLLSPMRQESPHPYYPKKAQAMTVHNGTPVPSRFLMRGQGAALSPTVFATDKGIPVSLSHHYPGVASSSNVVHIQQSLLARANQGNHKFTFNAPNAQYQPGYYSPVCQCYLPNIVASQMAGSGLQTGMFPPHSYYQAGYPMNVLHHTDLNQVFPNEEPQEVKKCDINLETIFQIADEVMQTAPSTSLVRVVTPEKPGPVVVPSSNICNTTLLDNSASTMKALAPGSIMMAVAGNAHLVKYEQQEVSVVSVPEQMPEDAICEITTDDAKDVIGDVFSGSLRDTSHTYNSRCIGRTPNL